MAPVQMLSLQLLLDLDGSEVIYSYKFVECHKLTPSGSMTFPPCQGNVSWFVLQQFGYASYAQVVTCPLHSSAIELAHD